MGSNIHPIGFVDIRGQLFRYIADRCSFAILPSCSEGISASVLTAMSAGVIPIVSQESGFEEDEVHHLRDSTIDEIGTAADQYASKSLKWIIEEANRVLGISRERYSAQQYIKSVRAALRGVMEGC
jgi:glycosyltransferase involved in cell wall biosynthesis